MRHFFLFLFISLVHFFNNLLLFYWAEKYILEDEELKDAVPIEYLSHAEKYAAELHKACLLAQKVNGSPTGQVETLR